MWPGGTESPAECGGSTLRGKLVREDRFVA